MHTPIQALAERYTEESKAIQEKFGHLMDIISRNDNLDTELFEMKRQDYAGQLHTELGELMEKYHRIAHHDSQHDRERLKEMLNNLREQQRGTFLSQFTAKGSNGEVA